METITPLMSGRALPDLSVVEFAVMIALVRLGPQPAPGLLPALSDWFGYTISLSDIQPALRRLGHLQYLVEQADGSLLPQRSAATQVSKCFTALIRIVGTEFERALKEADQPMLKEILRKTPAGEAIKAETALRKRLGKRGLTDAEREEIRQRVERESTERQGKGKGPAPGKGKHKKD